MNLTAPPPLRVATPGVTLVPLASGRWRVTGRTGALLGHIEPVAGADGTGPATESESAAFRAVRFSPRERAFRSLGEFRTAEAAADALRFG